jgi:hypothetical protein
METFLATLTANAIIVGALAYLVKTLLGQRLEKDLLTFRADIERKASEEIERFRAQLEKDRLRLRISYGGIFERQAEAIIELHDAVLNVERGASAAVHSGDGFRERREHLEKPISELRDTLLRRRILFPPELDEAMDAFLKRLPHAVRTYVSADSRDFTRMSPEEMESVFSRQDRALEVLEDEVPALREQIVTQMRKTIGTVASEF